MIVRDCSYEILAGSGIENLEKAGRTCYKSEHRIADGSAEKFVKGLIKSGHTAMIEHGIITALFVTNRGVTHEIVRHRVASFGQESTRYVKYGEDMEFVKPAWWKEHPEWIEDWLQDMGNAQLAYCSAIDRGQKAQQARGVLPNDLKTEITVTANFREWRHIFNLRVLGATGTPHPDIKALFGPMLIECGNRWPSLFGDQKERYEGTI